MWSSRLSKEDRSNILDLYQKGEKVKKIAQLYNVHHTYPTLLARRSNLPTRNHTENKRFKENDDGL